MPTKTRELTRKEQIEQRIAQAQARYDELFREAEELPGLLREAQEGVDTRRAATLIKRAEKELPSELAHAKADKLDAMVDLERLDASEADELAEPLAQEVNGLDREIEKLMRERANVRDQRDRHWSAAKQHRLSATEYSHEARKLRAIHDPRKQESFS